MLSRKLAPKRCCRSLSRRRRYAEKNDDSNRSGGICRGIVR
jgi:hypothetical protein